LSSLTSHLPLLTTQPGQVSLVHFPRDLYASWLQPVLRTLLPQTQTVGSGLQWPDHALEGLSKENQHTFLNVSVTPLECSVVCHSAWADQVFRPAIEALPPDRRRDVFISRETYNALSVISGDVDIVGRIMELTSPLALAGIPIFFISTYYSDFILVPAKSRQTVESALADRGFILDSLEKDRDSFVARGRHGGYHNGSGSHRYPPAAPAPAPDQATVAELFARTFGLLKKRSVEPAIEPALRLVQLSARDYTHHQSRHAHHSHPSGARGRAAGYGHTSSNGRPALSRQGTANGSGGRNDLPAPSWLDDVDTKLYASLVSALVSQPRFFSTTFALGDPASFLLEPALLPLFGDALVGDPAVELVPVTLDLRNMPLEATGVVCAVAGKLVQEMRVDEKPGLSYLSTASAGTVIMSPEQAAEALDILRPLMSKEG
jgi:hypothetical protein